MARRRFVSRRGLVFSGFVLVLLVISIGTTIATAGPTAYAAFGLALRSSQTAANRTVAAVDGRPITEADLLRALASATLNNTLSPNKVSDTQRSVLQGLIEASALDLRAEAEGIRPTSAEVAQYVADVRRDIDQNPRALAPFREFLAALGKTEDQYFGDPSLVGAYKSALAVSRLRGKVVGGLASREQNSAWDAFRASVVGSSHIVILDATLQ